MASLSKCVGDLNRVVINGCLVPYLCLTFIGFIFVTLSGEALTLACVALAFIPLVLVIVISGLSVFLF